MCILSGCDYLAPLGGIGLKTLHKYFLKFKTLDRVLYALRREANKLISKEYETEFLKAELTFQHQRVFCPLEKKIVPLNPLPSDICANFELETDELFEDLNFLGPVLDSEIAQGIAEGRLNPVTFKPFIAEEEPRVVLKENELTRNSIPIRESPRKLNSLLLATMNGVKNSNSDRLTVKRSFSTESHSIQQGLRSKFMMETPKYSNIRKATKSKSDGKQFSILNFCVPKASFDQQKRQDT
jgi:5'-3' exonuclease